MLGFSLYPLHLKGGSGCTLRSFCEMVARTAELMGVERIGIGSDLCQDQPDSVVEWMRVGRWTRDSRGASGPLGAAVFPPQPDWFRNNTQFANIAAGLAEVGFSAPDIDRIMGGNWLDFFERSFGPQSQARAEPRDGGEARCEQRRLMMPRPEPVLRDMDGPASGAEHALVVALRSPDMVMRLERLGSFHQTRLSFMRVLLRRLDRDGWRLSRVSLGRERARRGRRDLSCRRSCAQLQPGGVRA